jgi:hypothetical protein
MMKRFFMAIVLAGCVFGMTSCLFININDGDWDDNIKLSSRTLDFHSMADSSIITTGGTGWWITDISVNDEWFNNFDGIDMESNFYTIKQDCFTVERRGDHTLFIKLKENSTGKNRVLTVGLESGDYFDRVVVNQDAH